MAAHSSTLAWKIPWTEEPGRLQSMGSLRVGHNWATSLSCTGEGNGNPLQCSCLKNPRDGGAWWAAVYGVAQSRTRLKRLSSSSSSNALNSIENKHGRRETHHSHRLKLGCLGEKDKRRDVHWVSTVFCGLWVILLHLGSPFSNKETNWDSLSLSFAQGHTG